jgi:hypothetical protein
MESPKMFVNPVYMSDESRGAGMMVAKDWPKRDDGLGHMPSHVPPKFPVIFRDAD